MKGIKFCERSINQCQDRKSINLMRVRPRVLINQFTYSNANQTLWFMILKLQFDSVQALAVAPASQGEEALQRGQ